MLNRRSFPYPSIKPKLVEFFRDAHNLKIHVFIQSCIFAMHSKWTHNHCGSFLTSFRVNGTITFLSLVVIFFKIEYIYILLEWWTTRYVVKWLRWLVVGLSGQAVWQSVRGLHTGTCWWIALHIFTLTFKSRECQC